MPINIKELSTKAKKEIADLTSFKSPSVVGISQKGNEWTVLVELVEKESIPDGMDLLGLYSVRYDAKGDLLGYDRKGLRKRIDTGVVAEEINP